MSIIKTFPSGLMRDDGIALALLVKPSEKRRGKYDYVATRYYDIRQRAVKEQVIDSSGDKALLPCHALWASLPQLDISTGELIGCNKDKYCTLLSVWLYDPEDAPLAIDRNEQTRYAYSTGRNVYRCGKLIGYRFIDINGDIRNLTLAELRQSDILAHAHSVNCSHSVLSMMREVNIGTRAVTMHTPMIDVDDNYPEDEELSAAQLLCALVGSWYTLYADGSIQVDKAKLIEYGMEEIELPEGVTYIASSTFQMRGRNCGVKRIRLPDTVRYIGDTAFDGLAQLEEINIPCGVKDIYTRTFAGCASLKTLDLSGIERMDAAVFTGDTRIEHLIMPDTFKVIPNPYARIEPVGAVLIDTLEFKARETVQTRVVTQKGAVQTVSDTWRVNRLITNGAVVLGNYGIHIECRAVAEVTPNLLGFGASTTFSLVDAYGASRAWPCGASVRYIRPAMPPVRFEFTEEALKAQTLVEVYIHEGFQGDVPSSVKFLSGADASELRHPNLPNVVYAKRGLLSKDAGNDFYMPKLRWVFSNNAYTMHGVACRATETAERYDVSRTLCACAGLDYEDSTDRHKFILLLLQDSLIPYINKHTDAVRCRRLLSEYFRRQVYEYKADIDLDGMLMVVMEREPMLFVGEITGNVGKIL